MTDTEKAKAYDKAIEIAKKELNACGSQDCDAARQIYRFFPELIKESDDELIRKAIIDFFESQDENTTYSFIPRKVILDWLEKQGEHDNLTNCKQTLSNYDEAEKEKHDFVSGQYIECRKSFDIFKEDNSYWLEYIGDDYYIGRSDNILNQRFHITPRQLFTLFTQQHCPKEDNEVNEETNAPTEEGKYINECLIEASNHFFSEGEDSYTVAELFYAGVRCGKNIMSEKRDFNTKFSKDEEKSSDKIEPKFHEGDWVVSNFDRKARYISEVHCDEYNSYYVVNGKEYNIEEYDRIHHHWTIQDAKDGDVLCTYECDEPKIVFVLKGTPKKYYALSYYCYYNIMYPHFETNKWPGCIAPADKDVRPTTKEQRDLLFAKMHEAGYNLCLRQYNDIIPKKGNYYMCIKDYQFGEHDYVTFEKGKLYKSEKDEELTDTNGGKCAFGDATDFFRIATPEEIASIQKSSEWSEDDEEAIDMAITALEDMYDPDEPLATYAGNKLPFDRAVERLKSLKDRVIPQQKQCEQKPSEWSEDDIQNIQDIDAVLFYDRNLPEDKCIKLRSWLENLKDRIQPKQEWSEWTDKEKEYLNAIIFTLREIKSQPLKRLEDWDGYISLLEAIKNRKSNKEWSEEDERINHIIEGALQNILSFKYVEAMDKNLIECIDWLKSLKDRVIQPKQER